MIFSFHQGVTSPSETDFRAFIPHAQENNRPAPSYRAARGLRAVQARAGAGAGAVFVKVVSPFLKLLSQ